VTCLAIEAFALVLDWAAFWVPGRIGVQEAGRVLVFTTFGLSAALKSVNCRPRPRSGSSAP
jgi:hypothetical protein